MASRNEVRRQHSYLAPGVHHARDHGIDMKYADLRREAERVEIPPGSRLVYDEVLNRMVWRVLQQHVAANLPIPDRK